MRIKSVLKLLALMGVICVFVVMVPTFLIPPRDDDVRRLVGRQQINILRDGSVTENGFIKIGTPDSGKSAKALNISHTCNSGQESNHSGQKSIHLPDQAKLELEEASPEPEVAKPEQVLANLEPEVRKPNGTVRKRVRVIRKTIRRGKVVRSELIGPKTLINDGKKTLVKDDKQTYDEVWYSDILNGNFKAQTVRLTNKTRQGQYLTEKLWRFGDTDSERLFLYNKLLQHGWQRNISHLHYLREELAESGITSGKDFVVTRENTPLNSSLPFYINTKVLIGRKAHRLSSYRVSEQFRQNIPVLSPFQGKTYRRCAVVGNSGSILNSGCGQDIDSFDMVFRCNAAPIEKFANDAGWKSNLTTFNPSIFYKRFNALKTREDYLRFRQNITQYHGLIWLPCFGAAALHNVCLTPILVGDSQKPNEPQLVAANPNQFINFWNFWKKRNVTQTPSTGFFVTHAALQLCDETHLYGFWPFPIRLDSGFERVPYHYFDDIIVSKAHSMSEEFSVFLQYHELGIIRLHTGQCQGNDT